MQFATSTSDSGVFMISTTFFLVHLSLLVFGLCTRYVLKRSITLYQWLGWSIGSPEQLSPQPLSPESLSPESLSPEPLLV
uniref:Uncharacterized protein n=1 Tax=Kalanchoe fedtschenkoi TaxID=63787 RepID=A0A7N0VKX9_KALFE